MCCPLKCYCLVKRIFVPQTSSHCLLVNLSERLRCLGLLKQTSWCCGDFPLRTKLLSSCSFVSHLRNGRNDVMIKARQNSLWQEWAKLLQQHHHRIPNCLKWTFFISQNISLAHLCGRVENVYILQTIWAKEVIWKHLTWFMFLIKPVWSKSLCLNA